MIAEFKPTGRVALALSAMLMVVLCCFTFTRAAEKPKDAPSAEKTEGTLDRERRGRNAEPPAGLAVLESQLERMNANGREAQEKADTLRRALGISEVLPEGESLVEVGNSLIFNPESVRQLESERIRLEGEYRGLQALLTLLKARSQGELQSMLNVAFPDELLTSRLKARSECEQKLANLSSNSARIILR